MHIAPPTTSVRPPNPWVQIFNIYNRQLRAKLWVEHHRSSQLHRVKVRSTTWPQLCHFLHNTVDPGDPHSLVRHDIMLDVYTWCRWLCWWEEDEIWWFCGKCQNAKHVPVTFYPTTSPYQTFVSRLCLCIEPRVHPSRGFGSECVLGVMQAKSCEHHFHNHDVLHNVVLAAAFHVGIC